MSPRRRSTLSVVSPKANYRVYQFLAKCTPRNSAKSTNHPARTKEIAGLLQLLELRELNAAGTARLAALQAELTRELDRERAEPPEPGGGRPLPVAACPRHMIRYRLASCGASSVCAVKSDAPPRQIVPRASAAASS